MLQKIKIMYLRIPTQMMLKDETATPTTSQGRLKGRSGVSENRDSVYKWRKNECDVNIQMSIVYSNGKWRRVCSTLFQEVFWLYIFYFLIHSWIDLLCVPCGDNILQSTRVLQKFRISSQFHLFTRLLDYDILITEHSTQCLLPLITVRSYIDTFTIMKTVWPGFKWSLL